LTQILSEGEKKQLDVSLQPSSIAQVPLKLLTVKSLALIK
jgi:hypothetical protein